MQGAGAGATGLHIRSPHHDPEASLCLPVTPAPPLSQEDTGQLQRVMRLPTGAMGR